MKLEVLRAPMLRMLRNYSTLRAEFEELASQSFEEPTSLLDFHFSRDNEAYILRDTDGALLSYFMVCWEWLRIRERMEPAVFLGFLVTRQEHKNSGIGRRAFEAFISNASQWERDNHQRLWLWGSASTPISIIAVHKMFADVQPAYDGSYTGTAKETALAIRQYLGVPEPGLREHPFVLRALYRSARETLYSASEDERINRVCQESHFHLLSDLNVDVGRGDRLLLVFRTPQVADRSVGLAA